MDRLTEGPPLGHDKEADVSVLGMGNGRRLGGVVLTEAGARHCSAHPDENERLSADCSAYQD